LFRGLRLRLTLWYSGVLAFALLVCGLVLYFELQELTLTPVMSTLRTFAEFETYDWQFTPGHRCGMPGSGRSRPPGAPQRPRPGPVIPVYMACYATDGTLLGSQPSTAPGAFLNPSLVQSAVVSGSAIDTVEDGDDVGPIQRFALTVADPSSGGLLGVVLVGRSIAPETNMLELLRNLLLIVAGVALVVSVGVGLLLAERALEPARLAFSRQQAFIADASHQLRTPLTLLRADAEVLLRSRDQLDPDDAELLDDIVAETAHMDHLATNLLALARLDARGPRLELEVIDLSELAKEIARRVASVAQEKDLRVAEDYSEHPRFIGDRHAVEQAALILVDNAIKYTPEGGAITLRTSAEDGKVAFAVEDTGVGIPPDRLEHLGERFYRVDPARSHKGGAGLGLAIARGIAAAHGGTVELTSTIGAGTSAKLTLRAQGPAQGKELP
jgi:signal transduction histidine kinase